MNWIILDNEAQLDKISEHSHNRPQLIFKHSTRCGVSSMVQNRLNKGELPGNIDFYFLDLIRHRNLSNKIAERYGVTHESPQVLLIKNGACVFTESHHAIYLDDILEHV